MPCLRPLSLARAIGAILLAAPLAAATPILSQRERDGWVEAGETAGCVNWVVEAPSGSLYGYSGQPGDLHRSEDGGATWTAMPAPPGYFFSILVSPLDSATLYATGQGLHVSRDAGFTWELFPSAPPYLGGGMVIDPFLPETLFVIECCSPLSINHLWMSPDGGESWVERSAGLSGPGGIQSMIADPRTDGVLLASLSSGLYRTVDRGVHWSRISDSNVGRLRGFDAATSEIIWAVGPPGPIRSADGGVTWSPIDVIVYPPTEMGAWVRDLVPDPGRPHTAYATVEAEFPGLFFTQTVRTTTDDGNTWSLMSGDIDAIAPSWIRALAIGPDARTLWTTTCGTPNAVYRLDLRRPRELQPR
jgi:hypothetical protein